MLVLTCFCLSPKSGECLFSEMSEFSLVRCLDLMQLAILYGFWLKTYCLGVVVHALLARFRALVVRYFVALDCVVKLLHTVDYLVVSIGPYGSLTIKRGPEDPIYCSWGLLREIILIPDDAGKRNDEDVTGSHSRWRC